MIAEADHRRAVIMVVAAGTPIAATATVAIAVVVGARTTVVARRIRLRVEGRGFLAIAGHARRALAVFPRCAFLPVFARRARATLATFTARTIRLRPFFACALLGLRRVGIERLHRSLDLAGGPLVASAWAGAVTTVAITATA